LSKRPELETISLPDSPAAWEALGFTVEDEAIALGGVRIRLGGTAALELRGLGAGIDLDGLPIGSSATPPPPPAEHPNGATAVDHVVVLTPDIERTARKLAAAGLDHRPSSAPQEFFVLGPCLLELAGPHGDSPRLWGLTLVARDLEAAARRLGDRLGTVKAAVQPGRRIATVTPAAGLTTALALITPRNVN
jgi:hypothetical protein